MNASKAWTNAAEVMSLQMGARVGTDLGKCKTTLTTSHMTLRLCQQRCEGFRGVVARSLHVQMVQCLFNWAAGASFISTGCLCSLAQSTSDLL